MTRIRDLQPEILRCLDAAVPGQKLIVVCTRTNCESLINGDNFKRTLARLVSVHKFQRHGFRRKLSVNCTVICPTLFRFFFCSPPRDAIFPKKAGTQTAGRDERVAIQMRLNVPFSIRAREHLSVSLQVNIKRAFNSKGRLRSAFFFQLRRLNELEPIKCVIFQEEDLPINLSG